MSWKSLSSIWPHLRIQLGDRFRHLDPTALTRLRGDRAKLVLYLAETHDLTTAEANDTLDDWLMVHARHLPHQNAA